MIFTAAFKKKICPLLIKKKKLTFLSCPNNTSHLVFLMSLCFDSDFWNEIECYFINFLECYFKFEGRRLSSEDSMNRNSVGQAEVRKWQEKTYENGNTSRRHPRDHTKWSLSVAEVSGNRRK